MTVAAFNFGMKDTKKLMTHKSNAALYNIGANFCQMKRSSNFQSIYRLGQKTPHDARTCYFTCVLRDVTLVQKIFQCKVEHFEKLKKFWQGPPSCAAAREEARIV